jgi:hypothetical protein
VKSLFLGGGRTFPSKQRVRRAMVILPGWQHFRFVQGQGLGSNSDFGFMAGGGLDFKIWPRVLAHARRLHRNAFQSDVQSNFSVGTGLVIISNHADISQGHAGRCLRRSLKNELDMKCSRLIHPYRIHLISVCLPLCQHP